MKARSRSGLSCVDRSIRHTSDQGAFAMTFATVAVSFFAYGTSRNSFGPCAFDFGPSISTTMNCDFGKPSLSIFISGMVPPCPMKRDVRAEVTARCIVERSREPRREVRRVSASCSTCFRLERDLRVVRRIELEQRLELRDRFRRLDERRQARRARHSQ